MNPIEYIRLRKADILLNCIKDNNLSDEEAEDIVIRVKHIINLLSPCRFNEMETREIVNGFCENLSSDNSLVLVWLIKAIKLDYTYVYAYNYIAQKENRKEGYSIRSLKDIDEIKLFDLIEEDRKSRITSIRMATLGEMIERMQKQLDQLEHLINGVKPSIDFDALNWKQNYKDIYMSFINSHFKDEGYSKLKVLKDKCEYVFNLLSGINSFDDLRSKQLNATAIMKFNTNGGATFTFSNEKFTSTLKSLYEDFYLNIVELVDTYSDKFAQPNLGYNSPKLMHSNTSKDVYSALEWATIYYYVDETNLSSDETLIKDRMMKFMEKHNVRTTFKNLKVKYYEAKKRINVSSDYPIEKLRKLIPFLEENYKQTITKIENDITFLHSEQSEY